MVSCRSECKVRRYLRRVTLQKPAGTPDEFGQINLDDDANWKAVVSVMVNFESHGGREFLAAQQVHADLSHILKCRYSRTVKAATPDHRLLYRDETGRSRKLNIIAIEDIEERRQELRIFCSEKSL